jgi:hypothetical protein
MKPQHFVLTPEQHAPALNVLGTHVTVLASTPRHKAMESHCSKVTRERGLHRIATTGTNPSTS